MGRSIGPWNAGWRSMWSVRHPNCSGSCVVGISSPIMSADAGSTSPSSVIRRHARQVTHLDGSGGPAHSHLLPPIGEIPLNSLAFTWLRASPNRAYLLPTVETVVVWCSNGSCLSRGRRVGGPACPLRGIPGLAVNAPLAREEGAHPQFPVHGCQQRVFFSLVVVPRGRL